MPKHTDEALVAYLDNELDSTEREHVEAWLGADPTARERMAALAQADELAREAFAEVLDEAAPERLIAAAHGAAGLSKAPAQDAEILVLHPRGRGAPLPNRRWGAGLAAAAALLGVMIGSGGTYLGRNLLASAPNAVVQQLSAEANDHFLENAAG
jgi:anti-sigma factor RsiW